MTVLPAVRRRRVRVVRALSAVVSASLVILPGAGWSSPSVSAVSAVARGVYTPVAGPAFNNPTGTVGQQRKLLNQVISSVNSAPVNSTIRMAVFSFGDPETADALIAAYQRGTKVRLIFSGSNEYPAMKRLQGVIGGDIGARSFVVFCDHSCRGTHGEMHAKYFSFNKAGTARFVTMVGSVNLTQNNAEAQWSDLYTVIGRDYFMAYRPWFAQLKRDLPVEQPYLQKTVGSTDIEIAPIDLKAETDPVRVALDKVTCEVPMGDIDPESETPDDVVRTNVYIGAHAWNGERGKSLAWRVAALQEARCRVKVFYGVGMGAAVLSILENHGVTLRKGTHKGIRTHEKMMIVQGGFDGSPSTVRAWTGSHNWSSRALGRDDLIVQINDEYDAQVYADQFLWMWKNG